MAAYPGLSAKSGYDSSSGFPRGSTGSSASYAGVQCSTTKAGPRSRATAGLGRRVDTAKNPPNLLGRARAAALPRMLVTMMARHDTYVVGRAAMLAGARSDWASTSACSGIAATPDWGESWMT